MIEVIDPLEEILKKCCSSQRNVFYKKDNEISLESSPQLHKVETILNEYDESLEKATEDNFVDLDSILFVPSYQGDYKFQKHWLMKWFNMLSINKTCLK
ncbi:hypothetical protein RhiirA1_453125 [Rhizophagus irregularis]|uniref:Uncharacterized protein n=1 Tax=Rhizophagus irregularis TaxID=588596 RepID=A0A2N0S8E5_9GLOM|nr:hypothetical protein RhiirA1_453125 [Rhizophagus irregularis]